MSRNRGRVTQRGKHATWKGETKVNVQAVEAIFKTEIVKMILLRTFQKSRDKRGVSFPGYSTKPTYEKSYKKKREKMGEAVDRVYLHLTGGLQRSITWLNVITRKDRHTVTFGAKPTRSRQVTTMANGGTGHYRETGKWGPRHNELLYYLGPGAPSNRRRDIMGLTKSERAEIARQIKNTSGVLKVESIVIRG